MSLDDNDDDTGLCYLLNCCNYKCWTTGHSSFCHPKFLSRNNPSSRNISSSGSYIRYEKSRACIMSCNESAQFVTNILTVSSAAVLGVLTRINVDALFGPSGESITSPDTLLFFDLPANMVGCFVLGAFNAFKARVATHPLIVLAISTGYAGSLTSMYNSFHFD